MLELASCPELRLREHCSPRKPACCVRHCCSPSGSRRSPVGVRSSAPRTMTPALPGKQVRSTRASQVTALLARATREAGAAQEAGAAREVRATREAGAAREAREARPIREAPEASIRRSARTRESIRSPTSSLAPTGSYTALSETAAPSPPKAERGVAAAEVGILMANPAVGARPRVRIRVLELEGPASATSAKPTRTARTCLTATANAPPTLPEYFPRSAAPAARATVTATRAECVLVARVRLASACMEETAKSTAIAQQTPCAP